jgi:hypothetical protein
MHAVWFTHRHGGDEPSSRVEPTGFYDRISHKSETGLSDHAVRDKIPELEALADEAREMARLVWLLASGCRATRMRVPRVSGYLQLADGIVSGRDPYLPPGIDGTP